MKKIDGLFWDTWYTHLVVVQRRRGMFVVSRHRTRKSAERSRDRLAESRASTYGVVELYANVRHDYKPGDEFDRRDVVWRRSAECCSECGRKCRPDSLHYRCPILAGNQLCELVVVSRSGRLEPPAT